MFTSNARQVAARQAADAAKHEAADAFMALDGTQKTVSMVVNAFAGLDAGTAGARLLDELAPLTRAADTASQRWIDALDAHAAALDNEDADVRSLRAAERAFAAAKNSLLTARDALDAFGYRHSDVEARVQAAWAQVSPKAAAAQQALSQARHAVAEITSSGVRSADLEAKLARAERLGKPIAEGPHKHGVVATLRYCDEATAAANLTITTAERLKYLAGATQRRLGSTRTRLEGVAGRLEQLEPTLSKLRRRFSISCSADLDQTPEQARAAVDTARRLLDQAKSHATAGQWELAAVELDQCRQHLAVAEGGFKAVVQRLLDLEAVAADPAKEKVSTRFVVRDAQALVVSAAGKVAPNEAQVLDSLVARLEVADEKLAAKRPDYWAYLVELRSVREVAQAVVRRTRGAMASR